MNTTSIVLGIFLIYWIIVAALDRRGVLEKYNISTYGPVLMIRTTKGQELLDRLATPKRFWRLFANIGIWLMFVGMIAMFLIVILSDVALLSSLGNNAMPEPGKFNEPRNILLIPGVNEFIPFTWGLIALVVTLVVHEFAHAILARVENIRVKSMGILLAIVPIGGFAEPDEEELFGVKKDIESGILEKSTKKAATRDQRARILAAGVMSNFIVALIAFLLFFGPVLGAITPLGDAMVTDVSSDSLAYDAGIREGMVITMIDDTPISSANDIIIYLESIDTGSTVEVHAAKDRIVSIYELEVQESTEELIQGVYVRGVVPDSPAETAGFEEGMRMTSINNNTMRTIEDFIIFMDTTSPGQTVDVEVVDVNNITSTFKVELAQLPSEQSEKGFLGVYYGTEGDINTPLGISVGEFPARTYLTMLKSIPSMLTGVAGWIIILGLPIVGFAGEGFPGFSGTLAQFYQPVGWAEPLGIGIFWIANSLLWIGWLNFYVGLFNCLPAVPLDGGHVFRDYTKSFVLRITGSEEKADRLSGTIAGTFSLIVLMSFLLMIFGPYIVHGF